jgi:hypothetical protein
MSQENVTFFKGWMVHIGVIAVGVLAIGGCGGDVDRDSYVQRNESIRESLPAFPGSTLVSVEHSPNRRVDGDREGPIVSYGTTVDYRVHAGTRPKVVSAFYKRRLKGWHVVRDFRPCPASSACPPTSTWFKRGNASIAVVLDDLRPHVRDNDRGKGGRIFTIGIDQDYYGTREAR